MILLGLLAHFLGDFLLSDILAQIVIIDLGFHPNQIDDPAEEILLADRQLDRDGIALKAFMHHLHDAIEVGAEDIHLVDECHSRNLILVRLSPNRLRLGLDAALSTENGNRAVEHAQRTLDLYSEVHVSGGVDDIDAVLPILMLRAIPVGGGGSRGDGDAAFLLLRHPVHGGGAIVGLADLVVDTGVIKNPFGSRGLTCVDMRHDTDVSGHFQRYIPRHSVLLLAK